MKCTSPCVPPCNNEATHELLNKSSKVLLGHNCEQHIAPLVLLNHGNDYVVVPLAKNPD